jgi:predicted phosphodiesterase
MAQTITTGNRMATRIAHLSDIHFESSDTSVNDQLCTALKRTQPHLLVVTGDLVDHCWNVQKGKRWLVDLCDRCGIPRKQVVLVPGNHDYRVWGNVGIRPITGRFFQHHFSDWNPHRIKLCRNEGVTFFRIDSNPVMFGFARGKVTRGQLKKLRLELSQMSSEDRAFVEQSARIVVLHHHPLPVPYEGGDVFLMIRSSHELLQFMAEQRIHYVLHGHKHRAPNTLLSLGTSVGSNRVVGIVGAGTAIKARGDRDHRGHNFNLLTIEDSGLMFVRQYFAQPGQEFQEDGILMHSFAALERVYEQALKKGVTYKHTHWSVEINKEGDAFNQITCTGVGASGDETKESVGPWEYSCESGHLSSVKLNRSKTSSGVSLEIRKESRQEVSFDVKFDPPLTKTAPRDYSLESWDFNSFAVNKQSFRRKRPGSALPVEHEEISLKYATDQFSWIMHFPKEYPLQHPPRFEVTKDGVRHEWLTKSLHPYFQYSETSLTASLSVHKPPVGYEFRISWDLPDAPIRTSAQNPGHAAQVQAFCRTMLQIRSATNEDAIRKMRVTMSTFAELIRQELEARLKVTNTVSANDIEISFMVYDDSNHGEIPKLRVVTGTQAGGRASEDFFLEVGDGNAGRAYELNEARAFDARAAREDPINETYVARPNRAVHDFLFSIPLRHPESQHQIFGVLNIGSYVPEQGRMLEQLNSEGGLIWLITNAQSYVLMEFLRLVKIDAGKGELR